jgi:hypothetical protein
MKVLNNLIIALCCYSSTRNKTEYKSREKKRKSNQSHQSAPRNLPRTDSNALIQGTQRRRYQTKQQQQLAKSNASAHAALQLSRKNTKQNPHHGGFKK